ncbi:elongation factor G [Buchnera aphidicola (Diuraphis noxia)]|uniref:Ion-translocating oxidoreductase complex subunit E n=1 Tax=Buchnera aphidicola subsp. Diuraphis noxia TaxID=118101 RepID=A0A1B2H9C6_BUCDN|nr:electron transport complex subunit E [Buchnera aphidicola]ANZ22787.1 elongation factor G [Buchnera aphidicola (Diuraphis noxia)]
MTCKNFLKNRLWENNASIVQLLGLCPVLAMTTNCVNAIGLGITTTLVLMITNTLVSCFKKFIPKNLRIPIYMILISSIVTAIEMLIHAYQFSLYQSLGVFIPLIVTNCIVLGRADIIAYKSSILVSFFDGFLIGLGSTISMLIIGIIREILGNGTLFFGINKIILNLDDSFFIKIFDKHVSVILAALPPGGFFILGSIIAIKNSIDLYNKKKLMSSHFRCVCTRKNKNI